MGRVRVILQDGVDTVKSIFRDFREPSTRPKKRIQFDVKCPRCTSDKTFIIETRKSPFYDENKRLIHERIDERYVCGVCGTRFIVIS
jgi:hypothetical protein